MRRAVDSHHGELRLSNRVGGGLDAVILLPALTHESDTPRLARALILPLLLLLA